MSRAVEMFCVSPWNGSFAVPDGAGAGMFPDPNENEVVGLR
jgi:hypothetical protein